MKTVITSIISLLLASSAALAQTQVIDIDPYPKPDPQAPVVQSVPPASAVPPKDRVYTISRFMVPLSAAYDIGTTLKAEQNPHIRELNPLLGTAVPQQIVVETAGTYLFSYATHYLYRHGHTRQAKVMNFICTGVHIFAGTHNIYVMRAH